MALADALRLYGPEGVIVVRSGASAIDAPSAGDWTPDNRNPAQSGDPPEDFILDAREWEDLRLVADFGGAGNGTESVEVTTLLSIPKSGAPFRDWVTLPPVTLSPEFDTEDVSINGHFCAFRITALDLQGATSVAIKVTGGKRLRRRAGG